MRVVLFSLGDELFALPFECVREVTRMVLPGALPRAPFGCLGTVDLRGERLAVLDLAAQLGLRRPLRLPGAAEALLSRHLLIANVIAVSVALVVDRVLEIGEDAHQAASGSQPSEPGGPGGTFPSISVGSARAALLDPSSILRPARRRLVENRMQGSRLSPAQ